jgi:ubiquitin-protein ligase
VHAFSPDGFPPHALAAPGISASPSEDNLRYFNVMILGPQQSPYDGAFLFLRLVRLQVD